MRPLPRLIALSPGTLGEVPPLAFLAALERSLAAGLPGFLLREPALSDRAYLALAHEVLALRARHGSCWFALHDRAHLAAALGADALHLSFRSLQPAELRPWLAPEIALGLSTHASDEPARWTGVEYLFHGPLHATPHKGTALAPIGWEGLARARAATRLPLFALGGVTPADVPRLRALGLDGVAVRGGIFAAPDASAATRAYLEALA